jgi:hypothetical protein
MQYHDPLNAGLVPLFQRPRDAAALCPFFHRSHSSAFCAAVNQIRDVTMKHLLTS